MNRVYVLAAVVVIMVGALMAFWPENVRDQVEQIRASYADEIRQAEHDSMLVADSYEFLMSWLRATDSTKQEMAATYIEWKNTYMMAPAIYREARDSAIDSVLGVD